MYRFCWIEVAKHITDVIEGGYILRECAKWITGWLVEIVWIAAFRHIIDIAIAFCMQSTKLHWEICQIISRSRNVRVNTIYNNDVQSKERFNFWKCKGSTLSYNFRYKSLLSFLEWGNHSVTHLTLHQLSHLLTRHACLSDLCPHLTSRRFQASLMKSGTLAGKHTGSCNFHDQFLCTVLLSRSCLIEGQQPVKSGACAY